MIPKSGYRFSEKRSCSTIRRPARRVAGRKSWWLIAFSLLEPSRRVGQHGVDLAGLRGEVGARHDRAAVVLRNVVEQPLELGDVAVDRLFELAVGAVALADLLEGALPLHGVEALGEDVAFAALVAVPQLDRRVMVDHAGDIDRERVE